MSRKTRFVIAGFGNVGQQVAEYVVRDETQQLEIAAIVARNRAKARGAMRELGLDVPLVDAIEAPDHAPIIVEAGTHDSFGLYPTWVPIPPTVHDALELRGDKDSN